MKAHDMREMTEEELQQHHDGLVEEFVNIRIKLAAKQLDNPLQVRQLRREIARAKTVLRDKHLGAKPGQLSGAKE
ncbi:MAG: 50S ribosomal protein L29 [Candidatus Krumholzibacteria bacterium]|nr:50S ribosomal protein L29 [Candidatus Krumholzibacteria bacterium]